MMAPELVAPDSKIMSPVSNVLATSSKETVVTSGGGRRVPVLQGAGVHVSICNFLLLQLLDRGINSGTLVTTASLGS